MRPTLRILLAATLALAAGGCFKTETTSVVGADGTAATRILFEIDLGAMDAIFGGMAEQLGGSEQPSMTEELDEDVTTFEQDLDALYEQNPELRDRFQASAELDGDVLRTELAVVTETYDQLEQLLDSVLGSGDAELGEILGTPGLRFPGEAEETGGGGAGMFSTVVVEEVGGQFSFRAELPSDGDLDDDLEFDFGFSDGLTPQVDISITAPGDIVSTNGSQSGRTVTWELDGSSSEPLVLRSQLDEGVTVSGLGDVGSVGGGSSDFPVALVVVIAVLVALAVSGWLLFRRKIEDQTPTTS